MDKKQSDDFSSIQGIVSSRVNNTYTRLYCHKHFRNRVIRLQALITELQIDAIMLMMGVDSNRDTEMTKLLNWLMFGLSSSDIHGSTPHYDFDDSFFVISRNSFQAYTNQAGFMELSRLTTLVSNCNIFVLTKAEENDYERAEVLKVSKFYEMVHDKKVVGVPVRAISEQDYKYTKEFQIVESWPLIQAYGLDMVGNGFFTMQHRFHSVRESLQKIYQEFDSFATFRVVFDEIDRLNIAYHNNFFDFNRFTAQKRVALYEAKLCDEFNMRYEFSLLQKKGVKVDIQEDGLPLPRALFGPERTNISFDQRSDKSYTLYKTNNADGKHTALHMTLEHAEKNTSIRFARTMFFTTLVKGDDYMKDVWFSDDDDLRTVSEQGLLNQRNALTLFKVYQALIKTYNEISHQFMLGKITTEELELKEAFDTFDRTVAAQGNISAKALPKDGRGHIQVHVKQYDSFGNANTLPKANARRLIMIRMQVKDIMSEFKDEENIGSVIYAQSFFLIDPKTYITVTKNVPNTQLWYTDNLHFAHVPTPILTEKYLICDQLGEREDHHEGLIGLLPVKEGFKSMMRDIILTGKLSFYEKGFIYTDTRLGAFVVPYTCIDKLTFHVADDRDWMEVSLTEEGLNLIPASYVCESVFYLIVPHDFSTVKSQKLEKLFAEMRGDNKPETEGQSETAAETEEEKEIKTDKVLPGPQVTRIYGDLPQLANNFSLLNFAKNEKEYKAVNGSEYEHFDWDRDYYSELLEFHAIQEYNVLKGKTFVPLNQFSEVYKMVQNKPQANSLTNTLPQIAEKLRRNTEDDQSSLISIILISGIPGSGKGRFAHSLAKQLNNEQLKAFDFKMPTIQNSMKYETPDFVAELNKFADGLVADGKHIDTVVAAMPSYHHLKKAIMELRKAEDFTSKFEIKFVITKVKATNFYRNSNYNIYQFLIENCMKGIASAVVFEKSAAVLQDDIKLMYRTLQNANPDAILPTGGSAFDLEQLSQILMRQNDRLNMLFTKHFYGFEKEGKSDYYLEGKVTAHYFSFKYPFKESLLKTTLQKAINMPINSVKFLLPKPQVEIDLENEEKENIQAMLNKMDDRERKKYEREQRKKARQEEDLQQEKIMHEQMDIQRRILSTNPANHNFKTQTGPEQGFNVVYERIRGLVHVETDDSQDYQLLVNHSEAVLKPLKNQSARLAPENLGILVYGRNISDSEKGEKLMREVLKTCRSQPVEKKAVRTRKDIKQEEIDALQEKYMAIELPVGWYFDGRAYYNRFDESAQQEHPNIELLIDRYLEEANGDIGEFNREVQKEWSEEAKAFD